MTTEMAYPGWASRKDVTMARPYPKEFRDDVVRVARNRGDSATIKQFVADFGDAPDDAVEVVTPGRY